MDQSKNLKQVLFYTLDGAIIPDCEELQHRNNIPIVMVLKRSDSPQQTSYALNLSQNFSIENEGDSGNRTAEDAYLSYCRGIGLPRYASYLLSNFANKLHQSLPKTKEVSSEDIINSA